MIIIIKKKGGKRKTYENFCNNTRLAERFEKIDKNPGDGDN